MFIQNLFVEGNLSESDDGSDYCDLESEPSECGFSESIVHKQSTGVLEKDLILVIVSPTTNFSSLKLNSNKLACVGSHRLICFGLLVLLKGHFLMQCQE